MGADKSLAWPGRKQATVTKLYLLQATQKEFRRLSVQLGLCSGNDLRVGSKMATFQLFFQSGRAMDLSVPLYIKYDLGHSTLLWQRATYTPVWTGFWAARWIRKSGIRNCLNCRVIFTVNNRTPIYKCGYGLETHDLDVSQLIYWNQTKYTDYLYISYYLNVHPRTGHEGPEGE